MLAHVYIDTCAATCKVFRLSWVFLGMFHTEENQTKPYTLTFVYIYTIYNMLTPVYVDTSVADDFFKFE